MIFFFCIIMVSLFSSTPKYIAHRAADNTMSENTLESMKRMHEKGAMAFEVDCHLMKDGTLSIIHDERLKRTTTGRGKITKMTKLDLLDVFVIGGDGGERIPLLQDLMYYCHLHNLMLMIEVKGKNLKVIDPIDDLIRAYDGNLFSIYAFEEKIVEAFMLKKPKYKVRWNMDKLNDRRLNKAKKLGIAINLNGRYVKHSDIEKLKTLDPEIHVFTVNNEDKANELFDMGVTSIITDTLIRRE